jgi:hypothetical protein
MNHLFLVQRNKEQIPEIHNKEDCQHYVAESPPLSDKLFEPVRVHDFVSVHKDLLPVLEKV